MIVNKAKEYATKAHDEMKQVRKYTNDPYIVHPASVAKIVSSVTNNTDMICAAWLHDVVEDTERTLLDIQLEFGNEIAKLVEELTDASKPEDGNRKIRKQIDLEHIRYASTAAKTIKLADLIDNSRSILDNDQRFAKVYMEEKKDLLEVLTSGHPLLYLEAKMIVINYFKGRKPNEN